MIFLCEATHLLNSHHRNMNQMWAEMTDRAREEYRQYFIAYHDSVARYRQNFIANHHSVARYRQNFIAYHHSVARLKKYFIA